MHVCPQCGRPVEVPDDLLDQFETPEDAAAAEPPLHPECALEHSLRPDRPRSQVLMYEGSEIGPLTSGPSS